MGAMARVAIGTALVALAVVALAADAARAQSPGVPPVTLGPDGTAYVGALGGLAAFR